MIRPGGLANALGIMRTVSRMVKDAARAETPFLRICDASHDYRVKYNLPLSKAVIAPVAPPEVAPKVAPPVAA